MKTLCLFNKPKNQSIAHKKLAFSAVANRVLWFNTIIHTDSRGEVFIQLIQQSVKASILVHGIDLLAGKGHGDVVSFAIGALTAEHHLVLGHFLRDWLFVWLIAETKYQGLGVFIVQSVPP